MDRGAWRATVHRVTTSRMQLKQLSMRAAWQTLARMPGILPTILNCSKNLIHNIPFCIFFVFDINNSKLYHFLTLLLYPLPSHDVLEFSLVDTCSSSGGKWIYSHFFSQAPSTPPLVKTCFAKNLIFWEIILTQFLPLLRIYQWFPQSSGSDLNSTPTMGNIWSVFSTPRSPAKKKKTKQTPAMLSWYLVCSSFHPTAVFWVPSVC